MALEHAPSRADADAGASGEDVLPSDAGAATMAVTHTDAGGAESLERTVATIEKALSGDADIDVLQACLDRPPCSHDAAGVASAAADSASKPAATRTLTRFKTCSSWSGESIDFLSDAEMDVDDTQACGGVFLIRNTGAIG